MTRALVVSLVLQAGLVLSCNYGTRLVSVGAELTRSYASSDPELAKERETEEAVEHVRRYEADVTAAYDTLWWTLLAYALCPPLVVAGTNANDRSRTPAATPTDAPNARAELASRAEVHSTRTASGTSLPGASPLELPRQMSAEERRRFYERAARALQHEAPTTFAVQKPVLIALTALIVMLCYMLPFALRVFHQLTP